MLNKRFIGTLILIVIPLINCHAEIALDNTLHSDVTELAGPNYQIDAKLGQQQGGNLFHSFKDFNLNEGESVTFSGPKNINNVISRVTGGKLSHINGLLRSTILEADVYLINPAGIFFGPSATLDIPGAFQVSTADVLHFQDGGNFNASQPNESVLTSAPVEAFGFLTEVPAKISIQESDLSVPAGQTISLIGGELSIEGKETDPVYHEEHDSLLDDNNTFTYSSKLAVGSGRLNLASIAGKGKVTPTSEDLKLSTQSGHITLKDVKLEASGEGGGAIYIRANQLILNNSRVEAKTLGAKNGKEINIQAKSVRLIRGGRLDGSTYGAGNGSDIKIRADDLIEVTGDNGYPLLFDAKKAGNSEISATLKGNGQFSPARKGGEIKLKARRLLITEGAMIRSGGYNAGQGGNVKIDVDDLVEISGEGVIEGLNGGVPSMVFSSVAETVERKINEGEAISGSIELNAGRLLVDKGGEIFTSTGSLSQAGDLKILVADTMTVSGVSKLGFASLVGSTSIANADADLGTAGRIVGKGGDTWIETRALFVDNGGFIDASANAPEGTQSQGGSGNIIIRASGAIKLSGVNPYGENRDGLGSGIYARSRGSQAGPAGSITIRASSLTLSRGATIASDTSSSAPGGMVDIVINGPLTISGSSANLTLKDPAPSQQIFQQTVPNYQEKTAYSGIHASSSGAADNSGQAGEITVSADTISLAQGGTINTSTNNAGGGHITITTPSQLYLQQGEVTTSVQGGKGDGGNITIRDPVFVILNGGQIKAQAEAGRGGNIRITSDNYFKSSESVVSASSKLGIDGKVTINSPEEALSNSLIVLPEVFVDTSTLLKSCQTDDEKGHFKVIKRVVNEPTDWLW